MKVLVCGGRDFDDRDLLDRTLDALYQETPISLVIHGGARGADLMAGEWALSRGVTCREFPADWDTHGQRAGPIRNQQMLDEGRPDRVVAFPGGSGTADMVRRADRGGVDVRVAQG